ncbi:hypothetical protein [Nocardiopsis oceani]
MNTQPHETGKAYDPAHYIPDYDEHGLDINRPLDDEETAALHRLDTGEGWLDQGQHRIPVRHLHHWP